VTDNSDSLNVTDPDYMSDGTLKDRGYPDCPDCTNQRQRP